MEKTFPSTHTETNEVTFATKEAGAEWLVYVELGDLYWLPIQLRQIATPEKRFRTRILHTHTAQTEKQMISNLKINTPHYEVHEMSKCSVGEIGRLCEWRGSYLPEVIPETGHRFEVVELLECTVQTRLRCLNNDQIREEQKENITQLQVHKQRTSE